MPREIRDGEVWIVTDTEPVTPRFRSMTGRNNFNLKKQKKIQNNDLHVLDMQRLSYRETYQNQLMVRQIATAIRILREDAGISQHELAVRIGTKQPGIARLENTEALHPPKLDLLLRVLAALGKQLTMVFGNLNLNAAAVRIETKTKRKPRRTFNRRRGL